MSTTNTIQCPNCNHSIDVNEVLYHQLDKEYKANHALQIKQLQEEVESKRKEYKDHLDSLKQKEEALQKQQSQFEEKVAKQVQQLLLSERIKLQDNLRKEILDEQSEAIAVLQKQLEEKSQKVKELNQSKALIEQLKREKDEMESSIKADAQKQINEIISLEREKIQKSIDSQNELKIKQKDEQLKQLQEQLQIAQRKAEQGSMQLQGEVQELAIEEYLTSKFPLDSITEIKKGQRGGDCIQHINTRELQNCGRIYYESKRAKDFQRAWIEKFKTDMREIGCDVGVLVTQVLPKELDRMGLIDGVWICTYEEFKALSEVLRESIIKLARLSQSQENKTDKMSLLYSYLTSNEFVMHIEAIVETFTQMQDDLDKEKKAMMRIWKQREKQIEKVVVSTTSLYGSLQGIAGDAIGHVKTLELPYASDEPEVDEEDE